MRATWRSKVGGWGAAVAIAVVLSAGGALAAGLGTAPTTAGRQLRCPHAAPRGQAPERWSAARHRLAPTGARDIRLCRYSGLNAHPPLALVRARLLTRRRLVARLVRRFDALPRGAPGTVACPNDDGSEILALLSYRGGRQVRISVGLTGCPEANNGSVHRSVSGNGRHPGRVPALLTQLERLVGGGRSAAAQRAAPGRWSVLARSPLGGRSQPALVWDGRELLEFGGGSRGRGSVNAGAAYNPETGRWHRVASAPGSVHPAGDATAWTGRQAFVYFNPAVWQVAGGVAGLYNPATNHWRVTAGVPVGPFNDADALWTGRRVILAGITDGNRQHLEVARYNPAANHWARMHPPIPRGHQALSFAMVQTNQGVLLWSLWSRTHRISRSSYKFYSGVDVLRLTRAGSWIRVTGRWPQHETVSGPVFTGRKVLLAPAGLWCGACHPPFPGNAHGYEVDPRTLHRRAVPHGPLDGLDPQIVWTGTDELSLDFTGEVSGPGGHVEPGDIAAWNPRTGEWTRGPRAPRELGDPPALWTGKRLLVMAFDGHLLAYTP